MNISGKTIKTVFLALVGIGADKVVTDVIESVMPAQTKPLAKIFSKIGTFAISLFVADRVVAGIDRDITDGAKLISDGMDNIKKQLEEEETEAEA